MSLSDERAKRKAANKRKGVVGRTGRNIPMKPKAVQIMPQVAKIPLNNFALIISPHLSLMLIRNIAWEQSVRGKV